MLRHIIGIQEENLLGLPGLVQHAKNFRQFLFQVIIDCSFQNPHRESAGRIKALQKRFAFLIGNEKADLHAKGKTGIGNRQASHKMPGCDMAVAVCSEIN